MNTVAPATDCARSPIDGRRVAVELQREAEAIAKAQAPLHVTPPVRRDRLLTILRETSGSRSERQEDRLLLALRGGTASTVECREALDIPAPASRVHALRSRGHNIVTQWVRQASCEAGVAHRYATYTLIAEAAQA